MAVVAEIRARRWKKKAVLRGIKNWNYRKKITPLESYRERDRELLLDRDHERNSLLQKCREAQSDLAQLKKENEALRRQVALQKKLQSEPFGILSPDNPRQTGPTCILCVAGRYCYCFF